MIGGLIFSQMLTLYTTPVIYLAFDAIARRFGGKSRPRTDITEGEEPPHAHGEVAPA